MDSGEARKVLMQHNNMRAQGGNVKVRVDRGHLSFDWGETAPTRRDKEGAVRVVPVVMGTTTYNHEVAKRDKGSKARKPTEEKKRAEQEESSSESTEEEWNSDFVSDEDDSRARKANAAVKKEKKADRQCYQRTRISLTEQQQNETVTSLEASFSLRYLTALTKHPMSSRVYFHLTHAMPLCIEYALRHEKALVGKFCSYVAPRMDE